MEPNGLGQQKPARKAAILIADDHPVVRYGISRIINKEHDMEVCGETNDGNSVEGLIPHLKPDLILMDLTMKSSDGLVITQTLAQKHHAPVLVLSMHDENVYARKALRAGARGYIMKEESADKLVGAIRCVLSGNVYLSENIRNDIINDFARSGTDLPEELDLSALSPREKQVFVMLGKGHAPKAIAYALSLSIKTVESHTARIKQKLALPTSHRLLTTATAWVTGNIEPPPAPRGIRRSRLIHTKALPP